jgi:hypothetical protein
MQGKWIVGCTSDVGKRESYCKSNQAIWPRWAESPCTRRQGGKEGDGRERRKGREEGLRKAKEMDWAEMHEVEDYGDEEEPKTFT